ncbi:unnamed protein product [Nippostrongylus brasiliensis]|uniref:Uncharacterized protein n=1 Tax=Nippostrongylus brasiliensis TaxID=27835 RepID=A0A0N4XSA6_NIPBR|nr:unnamed protein product [Nippostrongylus brasiliensis]
MRCCSIRCTRSVQRVYEERSSSQPLRSSTGTHASVRISSERLSCSV